MKLAEKLYLNRAWFWLQISIAVCSVLALILTPHPFTPRLSLLFWVEVYILGNILLVSIPVFGLWLGIAGWHDVGYRYATFWFALAIGKLWHWLSTGWRGILMILSATTGLAWLYSQVLGEQRALIEFLTPEPALQVLAVDAIIVVLYWAFNARRKIVLLGFTNATGDSNLKENIEGISNQLLHELASLAKLYQSIETYSQIDEPDDEQKAGKDPRKSPGIITGETLLRADIGETLQGIATSDSKVKLGPVEIPIGFLVATFGRLVEGPRLSGVLQRDGTQLVLFATLTGGGLHGNWRVNQSDLDLDETPNDNTHIVERLVNQLAYRIFTDLEQGNLGSVRWRAVYWFSQGLRAYRDALQSVFGQVRNLVGAEQAFTRALSYDDRFAQCHYNLAVTYRQLNKQTLARLSFIRAGEIDPSFIDAYLALAEFHWYQNNPEDWWRALYYCDYILQIDSAEPRAWRLKALALRNLNNNPDANEGRWLRRSPLEPRRAWAIEAASIGVALSWRRLCLETFGNTQGQRCKITTAHHLQTLGLLLDDANSLSSQSVLRQALYLTPDETSLYSNIGWAHSREGNFAGAIEAFQTATQMTNSVEYWESLAWACQRRYLLINTILKQLRIERPRQLPVPIATAELWAWKELLDGSGDYRNMRFEDAVKRIGQPPPVRSIAVRRTWTVRYVLRKNQEKIDEIRTQMYSSDTSLEKQANAERNALIKRLIQRRDFYEKHKCYWSASQIMIQLSTIRNLDDSEILNDFEKAIEWLEAGDLTNEVISRHLYRDMATLGLNIVSYGNTDQKVEYVRILKVAEQAVASEPYDYDSHRLLGQIYVLTHQLDLAEKELTTSLALEPNNPRSVQWLAKSYWKRLITASTIITREQAAQDAIKSLQGIAKIIEQQLPPTDKYQVSDRTEARGWTHYWLGRFYFELLDYDAALTHLRIAAVLNFGSAAVHLGMGAIYLKNNRYDQVEECCRLVLKQDVNRANEHFIDDEWGKDNRFEYTFSAHLLMAVSMAERGADLRLASQHVTEAVQTLKSARWILDDNNRRTGCIAKLLCCKGWLDFIAALENANDNKLKDRWLAKAARRLKSSASLVADADTYYKLGQVYTERANLDSNNREHWSMQATRAYRRARDLNLRGEYNKEIDALPNPPNKQDPKPEI
jgi:tetratricopeptide (TPR) repeat protein